MTEALENSVNAGKSREALDILVVDDDSINLYLIKTLLLRLGHKVDTARDGSAAVESFIAKVYDVILMDVMMPVMDGVTATMEIRKIEVGRKTDPDRFVKIIAITANTFEEDRASFFTAGMNYYMSKPLQVDELQRLLYC
ncbi:MAG: response regulator [Bacteroidota bacterium]